MKFKFMLGLAVVLLFLSISGSAQATNLTGTCGMVINTGGTYVLQNDILNCNPYNAVPSQISAITIKADNVVLDLNGHKVTGAGGNGINIYGARNVTIKNGTIEKFTGQGIVILTNSETGQDPSDIIIEKMTIQKNLRGIYGNRTGTVRNLTIRDNYFTGNTSGGAIVLFNGQYGKIYNNDICANGKFGISLDKTSYYEIYQNSISKQTNAAVHLTNRSDGNEIYLNGICYNYYGILIYSGSRNTFDGNSMIKNSKPATDYDPTNIWRNNYWSDHDCANPYVIPGGGNQKDSTPLCQPRTDAAPCGCGVGTICGSKWNDLNADGQWTAGEIGLGGWEIKLESPANPAFVPLSTTTARDGSYCFFGLKAGLYTVSETQQEGWTQTFPPPPGTHSGYLHDGEAAYGVSFGNTSWCPNPSIIMEKIGPVIGNAGDDLPFFYRVTNNGNVPLTNVTVNDDKCGNAAYQSGNGGGPALDPGETWVYSCTYTPSFPSQFPNCLTNVATATGTYGNQTVQAQDDYTLCPFVLRKKIFLYWDHQEATIPYTGTDNTPFTVKVYKDGTELGETTVSQEAERQFWLSQGTWKFCEVNVPAGYTPAYECITYTTSQGYPDWTYPNVITYDLAIDKTCPATAKPGETIIYEYKVTNAGPASVPAVVTDDKCSPAVYQSGDNGNGKVDPGEIWTFTCQYVVPVPGGAGIMTPVLPTITNTATVKDPNLPTASWFLGGDRNLSNNTDICTVTISDGDGGYKPGEFCTYTQGGWGAPPNGNNVGQLLKDNFDFVYPSQTLEVGISGAAGFSMLFQDSATLQSYQYITAYLPSGSTAGALEHDYVNPTDKNESGVFGGQVTALQLNVDFAEAGKMPQTGSTHVGALKLCNTGTSFDGQTVVSVLAAANTALGGGAIPTGFTVSTLNDLVDNLNKAFDNCLPSDWAQTNLCK